MLKITQRIFCLFPAQIGSYSGNSGMKALCKKITEGIKSNEEFQGYFEFDNMEYYLHCGDDTPTTLLVQLGGKRMSLINLHKGFEKMKPIHQAFVLLHEIGHTKMGHLKRMQTNIPFAIINALGQLVAIDLQEYEADLYAVKYMRLNSTQFIDCQNCLYRHLDDLVVAGIISTLQALPCKRMLITRRRKVLARM